MHAIYTLKQTLNNERVTSNKTQLRRQNRTLSNTELKKTSTLMGGGGMEKGHGPNWKSASGQGTNIWTRKVSSVGL